MNSPNIFLAVYEGVPGDAQLVEYDYGPTPPVSIVNTTPNDWTGIEGENFFAVAVGYTNFSEVLAENTFFTQGTGTPPDPYSSVQFKWGVPPTPEPPASGPTVVDMISAGALGVEAVGNLLYVAAGASGLQIYDASNSTSPTLVTTFNYDVTAQTIPGASYYVNTPTAADAISVTIENQYGFVLDFGVGLEILDLHDPVNPQLVGHFSLTPTLSGGAEEIPIPVASAISGSYAFIVEVENPNSPNAQTGRIEIVDVANPVAPVLAGSVDLGQALPNAVTVAGNYMYVTTLNAGASVEVFNITNPGTPAFVGKLPGTHTPEAVAVEGQLAFVADLGGLLIYNVADPGHPTLLSQFAGSYADVQIQGNIAYLSGPAGSPTTNAFVEVNISNPANPTFVGSATIPSWAQTTGFPSTLGFVGNDIYVPLNNWLFVVQGASTNQPPTIDTADSILTGSVTKAANATTSASLDYANGGGATKPSGVIAVTDANAGVTLAASADTADETVTYQGAGGQSYSLTKAQIQALEAGFQISAMGITNGQLGWTYGIPNSALPFLGTGETITLTVPVVITDSDGGTATQDVVVTINGANDNPVAKPVSVKVENSGTVYDTTAATGVLASDSDPNIHDALYISAVNGLSADVGHSVAGKYGTLTLNGDGSYSYVENLLGKLLSAFNIALLDTFSYTISDGHGGTASSTLSFDTRESAAPIAHADTATAIVGTTLSEDAANGVLANDTDANGYSLSVTSISTGSGLGGGPETVPVSSILPGVISGKYGTLTVNADGSYSYAETAANVPKNAHDVFSYAVSDGHGGTASATLTLNVIPPPPLQIANTVSVTDGVVAVEMIKLAVDAYPFGDTGYHAFDPFGTPLANTNPLAVSDIQADNWHLVTSAELGLSSINHGVGLEYTFSNGYYQAINVRDSLNGDPSEADALVLTGIVNGKKTLAIAFAGTDQASDWMDYANFANHYAKFAPLVSAIKALVDSGAVDQVLVSGHSLGAAMAQDFIEDPTFRNDPHFQAQAFTIGSPGSDNIAFNTPDPRITNFYHALDPIFEAPVFSDAIAAHTALGAAIAAGIVPTLENDFGFSPQAANTIATNLLNNLVPKAHEGTNVLIPFDQSIDPSHVFTVPLLGGMQFDFDAHDAIGYLQDIEAYYSHLN